jgi:hypothetical protein
MLLAKLIDVATVPFLFGSAEPFGSVVAFFVDPNRRRVQGRQVLVFLAI